MRRSLLHEECSTGEDKKSCRLTLWSALCADAAAGAARRPGAVVAGAAIRLVARVCATVLLEQRYAIVTRALARTRNPARTNLLSRIRARSRALAHTRNPARTNLLSRIRVFEVWAQRIRSLRPHFEPAEAGVERRRCGTRRLSGLPQQRAVLTPAPRRREFGRRAGPGAGGPRRAGTRRRSCRRLRCPTAGRRTMRCPW